MTFLHGAEPQNLRPRPKIYPIQLLPGNLESISKCPKGDCGLLKVYLVCVSTSKLVRIRIRTGSLVILAFLNFVIWLSSGMLRGIDLFHLGGWWCGYVKDAHYDNAKKIIGVSIKVFSPGADGGLFKDVKLFSRQLWLVDTFFIVVKGLLGNACMQA